MCRKTARRPKVMSGLCRRPLRRVKIVNGKNGLKKGRVVRRLRARSPLVRHRRLHKLMRLVSRLRGANALNGWIGGRQGNMLPCDPIRLRNGLSVGIGVTSAARARKCLGLKGRLHHCRNGRRIL